MKIVDGWTCFVINFNLTFGVYVISEHLDCYYCCRLNRWSRQCKAPRETEKYPQIPVNLKWLIFSNVSEASSFSYFIKCSLTFTREKWPLNKHKLRFLNNTVYYHDVGPITEFRVSNDNIIVPNFIDLLFAHAVADELLTIRQCC